MDTATDRITIGITVRVRGMRADWSNSNYPVKANWSGPSAEIKVTEAYCRTLLSPFLCKSLAENKLGYAQKVISIGYMCKSPYFYCIGDLNS